MSIKKSSDVVISNSTYGAGNLTFDEASNIAMVDIIFEANLMVGICAKYLPCDALYTVCYVVCAAMWRLNKK